MGQTEKECMFCDKKFVARRGDNRWCSKECKLKHYDQRMKNIIPIYKKAIEDAKLSAPQTPPPNIKE